MSIDMKEGEIFIAGEPDVVSYAVTVPRGFIAMDHVGGPDLVAQILIDRFSPCRRFAVKSHGGGRNKGEAEHLPEQLRRFSIGNPYLIA